MLATIILSPGGEIGRHARFRFWCRKVCRFESYPGHQFFLFYPRSRVNFFDMNRENIRSAIGVVFDESKARILLIKRRDVPIWVLPGGGVEENENPEDAVIREIYEETGLAVQLYRPVAIYSPINSLANLTYLFECKVKDGVLTVGDETRELAFFPIDNLPTPFFFIHNDWLNDALKNQSDIIQKPLNQVTYLALFRYFLRHPLHVARFFLSRLGLPINSR